MSNLRDGQALAFARRYFLGGGTLPIFGTGLPWAWASTPNAFSEAGSHVAIYHKEVVILLVSLRCLMFEWRS